MLPTTKLSPACKRAILHQHGGHRTASAIQLGFQHRSARRTIRRRLQSPEDRQPGKSFPSAGSGSSSAWQKHRRTPCSPPQSSGIRPRSASCFLTRSGRASGLSILFTATMIGTFAALAWSMASSVCGITPSSAATTSTTMSVTLDPRARMRVNASWPGVSRKTISRPKAGEFVSVMRDLVGADVLRDAAGFAFGDARSGELRRAGWFCRDRRGP